MRLLGIIHAHNEEDVIARSMSMLLESGHHVHVFDHNSTDGTADIVQDQPGVAYHRARTSFPALFNHVAAFINRKPHDWVTWMDADELLRDPDGNLVSRQAIKEEWKAGIGVIRPLVREFWLTDADNQEQEDHVQRLRHFRYRKKLMAPRSWLRRLTGTRFRQGRHRSDLEWYGRPTVNAEQWLLDHYPVRTVEQATRKIMDKRWAKRSYYQKYRAVSCQNLILDHRLLQCVDGGG